MANVIIKDVLHVVEIRGILRRSLLNDFPLNGNMGYCPVLVLPFRDERRAHEAYVMQQFGQDCRTADSGKREQAELIAARATVVRLLLNGYTCVLVSVTVPFSPESCMQQFGQDCRTADSGKREQAELIAARTREAYETMKKMEG